MSEEKKTPLTGLFRDDPATIEEMRRGHSA